MKAEAPLDMARSRDLLKALEEGFPAELASAREKLFALRSARIEEYVQDATKTPERLARRMNELRTLFPSASQVLSSRLESHFATSIAALAAVQPLDAHRLASAAAAALPASAAVAGARDNLPPLAIVETRAHIGNGRLSAAAASLDRARREAPDHPDLTALARDVSERQRQAKIAYAEYARQMDGGKIKRKAARDALYSQIKSRWTDNPEFTRVKHVERREGSCWRGLAAQGRTPEGVCYDLVDAKQPGALMVVVPEPRAGSVPFAISKHEISIADYNRYCTQSLSCRALEARNTKLPATGISQANAQAYAQWLSKRASASENKTVVYRLPTQSEWIHAARADGEEATKTINCRPDGPVRMTASLVRSGAGKLSLGVPIGRSLISTTFGEENGWGLVNAVGNAQEWVIASDGLAAQGGAYSDSADDCRVELARAHGGEADGVTGFRVVREID